MDGSRVCQLKRVFIWLPEVKLRTSVSSQSLANNIYFYMRFLYNFWDYNLQISCGARPLHSFDKCWKLYSADICKNVGMSFLGQYNVETVFCSKVAGFEGGLFQKRIAIQTICQWNKLKKKCSVCLCHYLWPCLIVVMIERKSLILHEKTEESYLTWEIQKVL